jgi:hypothetical protein
VEKGMGQATIIVIDPCPIQQSVKKALEIEGAAEGYDFDTKTVIDMCATAIVAGTPIAYLPSEMMKVLPQSSLEDYGTLENYTPKKILSQIGGGLSNALIFAARAHATFDVKTLAEAKISTHEVFRSPLTHIIIAEVLSTTRFFDKENNSSVKLLNEVTGVISAQMEGHFPNFSIEKKGEIVREIDSRAIDHIQAADIAAGWARDMLEVSDQKALGNVFERVWINGNRIK